MDPSIKNHPCVNKIADLIEKYKTSPNLELEGRFGFKKAGTFDTDIKRKFFKKIYDMINTFKWGEDSITRTKTTDYINSDGTRLTEYEQGGKRCIQKQKLEVVDIQFGIPFDFRVSMCREDPISSDLFVKTEDTVVRKKDRYTVKHDIMQIDLTQVETITNGVKKKTFELEIEIPQLQSVLETHQGDSYWIAHYLLLNLRSITESLELSEGHDMKIM